MNKRIKHIDVAKGISIILVAMFHSGINFFFPEIILPMGLFRMPLFFFLSGIFFSFTPSTKEFLSKKSEALLKPYFSVLIAVFIANTLLQSGDNSLQIEGILYGNGVTIKSFFWLQLWFLPHLFSVYCFSYVLYRMTIFGELSQNRKWIFLLILLFLGTIDSDIFYNQQIVVLNQPINLPGLPFSTDLIPITSVYFLAGHLLRKRIINFSPNTFYLILAIVIFIGIIIYSGASTDLNNRIYEPPLLATVAAISGIYTILYISSIICHFKRVERVFLAFGGASLYILIFHACIGGIMLQYILKNIEEQNIQILLSTIAFILSISLPLVIKAIVIRSNFLALFFLPFKTNKLLHKK